MLIPGLRFGLVALLILVGITSYRAIALGWSAPLALACAASIAICLRQLRLTELSETDHAEPRRHWRSLTGEFWRFASGRSVAAGVEVALVWLDVLSVGYLISPAAAAIYAAASRFITSGTLGLQAARVAIAPRLSRMFAQQDTQGAQRLHTGASQWIIGTSWPLYLTLAVFAPVVLSIFGTGFEEGAAALTIVALAMLVDMGAGNVQTILLMSGHSGWNMANKVTCIVVNVTLNLILIPHLGIAGAALAWAASISIDNIASAVEVRYLLGISTFHEAGARFVALAALACFGLIGLLMRLWIGASVHACASLWSSLGRATRSQSGCIREPSAHPECDHVVELESGP